MAGDDKPRLEAPTQLDEAQATALTEFIATRGHAPFGPFGVLLHSPELQRRTAAMGQYLRYNTVLPARLSEMAILIVARAFDQDEEWSIHQPIALKSGVPQSIVDSIAIDQRPSGMAEDETAVFDFLSELLETRQVSDGTYGRAQAAFGDRGVLDLTGLCGYYSLLAMVLNVTRTTPAPGPRLPPR